MKFKFDQAALEAVINKGLQEKQSEIIDQARQHVETQYCPEHGQFAELVDVHGRLQIHEQAQLQFNVCCDALREKVQAILREQGTDL